VLHYSPRSGELMTKNQARMSRFLTPILAEDLFDGSIRSRADELAYIRRPDRSRDEDGDECTDETDESR
jgi:hypothetical protein